MTCTARCLESWSSATSCSSEHIFSPESALQRCICAYVWFQVSRSHITPACFGRQSVILICVLYLGASRRGLVTPRRARYNPSLCWISGCTRHNVSILRATDMCDVLDKCQTCSSSCLSAPSTLAAHCNPSWSLLRPLGGVDNSTIHRLRVGFSLLRSSSLLH